jgi:hypothetical protein
MKQILLMAGAAALAIAGPAVAKPGHGQGHGNSQSYGTHGNVGYGVGGCPPGLAKKNNGCMPPGQAKKLYAGQHFASQYGDRYGFGQIPYDLRNRYNLDPRDRYYYGNGNLYQVDPRTMLVEQVISALLR